MNISFFLLLLLLMNNTICPICIEEINDNYHMLEPCNHIFHNECIIRCLRTNGPRCPLCRGVYNNNSSESNIHLNNNSSEFDFYNLEFTENQGYYNPTYFENTTTFTTPTTYYNIVYDSTGNDVTSCAVNSLTFNNETITYVPTNTISSNIISIETNISNNEYDLF